jgi:predicted trehalose synthase
MSSGSMLELSEDGHAALASLVSGWLARRGSEVEPGAIEVVEVEVLLSGRPGLLDVVARAGGRMAHLVLGLHPEGTDVHTLRGAEEVVLGPFADGEGPARAVNALFDAQLAPRVVAAISGEAAETVSIVRDDDAAVVLDVDDRSTLSVFPWLADRPHPAVEMLLTLDEVGFNHLAAPIARWRRHGRDLGLVQELLPESADGWALAQVSLRDLYGSRVGPEQAGGDFAVEARSLGTMTARLHLALDKAFGRGEGNPTIWAAEVASSLGQLSAGHRADPGAEETIARAAGLVGPLPTIRTHGDLHLGRTARTNQGWVVADWLPGGVDPAGVPLFRSPLADVADMCWSLHHVAMAALEERDLALRPGLEDSAGAWVARNRAAFLTGYLSTLGLDELVPLARPDVDALVALFELERAARWSQLSLA